MRASLTPSTWPNTSQFLRPARKAGRRQQQRPPDTCGAQPGIGWCIFPPGPQEPARSRQARQLRNKAPGSPGQAPVAGDRERQRPGPAARPGKGRVGGRAAAISVATITAAVVYIELDSVNSQTQHKNSANRSLTDLMCFSAGSISSLMMSIQDCACRTNSKVKLFQF